MFDDLVRTRDAKIFLKAFDRWQSLMEEQDFHFVALDLAGMVTYCIEYEIVNLEAGESPVDFALANWGHENAHREVAEKHGIRSVIRLTWLVAEDGGYLIQPWLHVNVNDLEKFKKTTDLIAFFGELLKAPELAGFGYEAEDRRAEALISLGRLGNLG